MTISCFSDNPIAQGATTLLKNMDNSNTYTTAKQTITERVTVYTDLSKNDAEKLAILTEGSKVPKGILLANLVYLQSSKTAAATQSTPTPAA